MLFINKLTFSYPRRLLFPYNLNFSTFTTKNDKLPFTSTKHDGVLETEKSITSQRFSQNLRTLRAVSMRI